MGISYLTVQQIMETEAQKNKCLLFHIVSDRLQSGRGSAELFRLKLQSAIIEPGGDSFKLIYFIDRPPFFTGYWPETSIP